jgi:hypothetical protein
MPGLYELEPVEILYQGERTSSLVLRLPRSRPSTPVALEHDDHTISLSVQFRGVVCGKSVPVCDDTSIFSRAAKSNQVIFDRKRSFKDALQAHVSAAVEKVCFVFEMHGPILF